VEIATLIFTILQLFILLSILYYLFINMIKVGPLLMPVSYLIPSSNLTICASIISNTSTSIPLKLHHHDHSVFVFIVYSIEYNSWQNGNLIIISQQMKDQNLLEGCSNLDNILYQKFTIKSPQ
jgi:ABC-type uncharacterized transport system permease subunit